MKKVVLTTVLAVLVCAGTVAFAASDVKTVAVTATVSATAKLTLGSATLTFPDADPDTTPSIAPTEGAITINAKAKTSAAGNVTLVVKSGGNLVSGGDSIAISNLTWTVTGAGYSAGTMGTTDQGLGSWTGSGNYGGTQTYALANSWAYVTGSYTATLTYTLTAP
jgi:hypothetical protein